jgi:hypothetical protein
MISFIFVIGTFILFYLVVGILTLFDVNLIRGDEVLYTLLLIVIGLQVSMIYKSKINNKP